MHEHNYITRRMRRLLSDQTIAKKRDDETVRARGTFRTLEIMHLHVCIYACIYECACYLGTSEHVYAQVIISAVRPCAYSLFMRREAVFRSMRYATRSIIFFAFLSIPEQTGVEER